MDPNIKKLNRIFELIKNDEKSLTQTEVEQFFTLIITVAKNNKDEISKDFHDVSQELTRKIHEAIAIISEKHHDILSEIDKKNTKLNGEYTKKYSELKSLIDSIEQQSGEYTKKYDELKSLIDSVEDGKDADEEYIISSVLEKIKLPENTPFILNGNEIVGEINKLPVSEENQIDWSHIKNAPESRGGKANGGGWRNLFQLHDVNIDNPTNNQILKYDSATGTWINSTGGGSGTPGGSSGDIQWNNGGSFDGFGTFNGINQLDLTGIQIISAGITTSGIFFQSGDQASFDVAGSTFAVKTTTYNGMGILYGDDAGLAFIGDYFGEGSATSVSIDDTAGTASYFAINGHTFTGNVGIEIPASSTAKFTISDPTLAASGALAGTLINATQTWNTSGSPTSIKLNVTNTASGASALLMDLQIGGVSQFKVDKNGAITTAGNVNGNNGLFTSSVRVGAAQVFYWNGRSQIQSPSDGVITMWDSATTSFSRLQLGGTTSSYPSIKRNTTAINFRLADDSADAAISAAGATLSGASTIADTVSAGSGSLAGSVLSATQTWNTSGTPTAWKLNVTDTASNAASLLIDLQVGGVSMFKVSKGGAITTNNAAINTGSGAITTTGNISGNTAILAGSCRIANTGQFYWNGRSMFKSSADGKLEAYAADGTTYSSIQSLYDRFGSGSPESVVTAPIGAVYHRTDGGAGTSLYVKESGTGNTGWVAK